MTVVENIKNNRVLKEELCEMFNSQLGYELFISYYDSDNDISKILIHKTSLNPSHFEFYKIEDESVSCSIGSLYLQTIQSLNYDLSKILEIFIKRDTSVEMLEYLNFLYSEIEKKKSLRGFLEL